MTGSELVIDGGLTSQQLRKPQPT
ncbi:uncharacterized protein METZ01_LOCUS127368 [marine metagenome]|uniref:Uncharacterized protein n=1 Tax=marine metagenome TaxID=408172 RepID=A0A381YC00_9ZZZZ